MNNDNKNLEEVRAIRNLKLCGIGFLGCIGTLSLCRVASVNPVGAIDFVCGIGGGIGIGILIKGAADDTKRIKEISGEKNRKK